MHPNFLLCFGCQRGGTTWLSRHLRQHPQTDFPPRKEIRYLDALYVHDFHRIQAERVREFRRGLWNALGENPKPMGPGLARELAWNARYALVAREDYTDDWYRGLFADRDPGRITGDFSPDYSLLPEDGVAHLARLLPDARLVFFLRNPVERTWSGATYVLRHQKDLADAAKLEQASNLVFSDIQSEFSDYRTIISRFERHFDPARIAYFFHDDLMSDPVEVLKGVCGHVGLPFDRRHFSGLARSTNRSPQLAPPNALQAELCGAYRPVLEWLAERFGGHCSHWLEEADTALRGARGVAAA